MKWVLFAGQPDKSDMVMYTAKIVKSMGSKVLVIDSTKHQLYKNSVSSIDPNTHLDEHDGVDVVTGIKNMEELSVVMTGNGETLEKYDYILVDVDNSEKVKNFMAEKLVIVTNYTRPSLIENAAIVDVFKTNEAGEELLRGMTKVALHVDGEIKPEYVFNQILGEDTTFHTLYDDEYREAAKIANQYKNNIDLKVVPKVYKRTLLDIIAEVFGKEQKDLKALVKQIDRGKI